MVEPISMWPSTGVNSLAELQLDMSGERYRNLGLKENPFPYAPIPTESPSIFCDQTEAMKSVSEMLSGSLRTGKSSHMILLGGYGNGKTHALRRIKGQLKCDPVKQKSPYVLPTYASQPGHAFLEMYREVMYDVGYQELRRLSGAYLGSFTLRNPPRSLGSAARRWERIKDGESLLAEVIPKAIQQLNNEVRFMDFTRAIVNLAIDEHSPTAWEWLSGEGADQVRRRDVGIGSNLNPITSMKALLAMKTFSRLVGFRSLVLLIDEFEMIAGLHQSARQQMLNNFRHLIDMSPVGLNVVFACTPEAWQSFLAEYHAFSERINREVQLKPLDIEHTRELVSAYLETAGDSRQRGLRPFDSQALQKVFELSMGNVRRVLLLCNRLVEIAASNGLSIIDRSSVDLLVPDEDRAAPD